MYIYQFSGDHTFTVGQVVRDFRNFQGLHFLNIRYENEYPFRDRGYRYPDQIYIERNNNSRLWNKTNILFSKKYPDLTELNNKRIRIKVEGLNYFFYVGEEQELIGIIHNGEGWDDVLIKQWEENDDQGFSDEEQAVFFGTKIEEINAQFSLIKKQKRLSRCKKSVFPLKIGGSTDLISYGVAISSSFKDSRNEDDEQNYYGTEVYTENSNSGTGAKAWEYTCTQYEHTLFPLIKSKEFKPLYEQLEDNVLTIDNNSKNSFLSKPFFKSIIETRRNGDSEIYVWIKFENVGDSAFDSYYFAVSYNKDIIRNAIIPQEANFLRQIFYLSSLSTQLLIKENEQKNEEQRKQALKTAIGSIMSRNMSHNIGSHCIQYTGASLLDLARHSIQCGPKIRGVSSLLFYIQGRMDFLAALISGERFSLGPLDFKHQIFNRLLQDDVIKLRTEEINNSKFKAITGNEELSPIITSFAEKLNNFGRDINGLLELYYKLIASITNIESRFDDNRKLTYNYILENLVKSENYTRSLPGRIDIRLQINGEYVLPSEYSSFSIAVPGGTLSNHALFIILENLIRNAAKHNPQENGKDLLETIRVTTSDQKAEFVIFDNKNNANDVCEVIKKRLCELQILDDSSQVEKNNKGLKEILFATLWLRALENKNGLQEILFEIDNAKGNQKIELINKYAFDIIEVCEKDINGKTNNFGIKFSLPLYKTYTFFDSLEQVNEELPRMQADIILCKNDDIYKKIHPLFPRTCTDIEPSSFEKMKSSVIEDYDSSNDFCIGTKLLHNIIKTEYGTDSEEISIVIGTEGFKPGLDTSENKIYFKRHLNSKPTDLERASQYLYADSITGNNFTNSLCQNFLNGINDGKYVDWEHKYQSLKIIESALARITIIDERFLGIFPERELELKNIRVLNLRSDTIPGHIFEGTQFKDGKDDTMFLSIHLGIIEKLLETKGNWVDKYSERYNMQNNCNLSRVEYLLKFLNKYFGRDGKPIYISIHSGRGNYSYELGRYFKDYPFIPLSSLWDAFYDSKYSLTQLFANNRYTDKIDINKPE